MASFSTAKPSKDPRLSDGSDASTISCTSSLTSCTEFTENSTETETKEKNSAAQQNIRVVTRIRPMSTKELNEKAKESVRAIKKSNTIELESKRTYDFDAVFGSFSSQKDVYDETAGEMIRSNLFKGFNVTVLAYGQTGSGKTHTMIGGNGNMIGKELNEDLDGIIPRAVHDVFDHMKQLPDGSDRMNVSLSYFEIYNEEARDLLSCDPNPPELVIRDSGGEVVVHNLSRHDVASPLEVATHMQTASERRSTAATLMNAVSSRSHAICTLYVKIAPKAGCTDDEEEITAKLTLVDLAGSERAKKTGAEGSRLKEGININKGLFVLGQVVSALSELSQQSGSSDRSTSSSVHVKYRDSKLTRLLQDSLGGNSKTVMVACVSPADINIEESSNTLRYAERTRSIKNAAVRNVVAAALSPVEAAALRRENQMLKLQLLQAQTKISSMATMSSASSLQTSFLTSAPVKLLAKENTVASTNSTDEELNGLDMKSFDIVTKLRLHCNGLQEKVDQLEAKVKSTVEDSLASVLVADELQVRCENLGAILQKNGIVIPKDVQGGPTSESTKIIENLRQEIMNLKSEVREAQTDAEVSRAIAGAVINGKGNIDPAETMALVSNLEIEDKETQPDATESLSAELVAMSGSIQQKELMMQQINKERECMEAMKSHFEDAITSLKDEVDVLSKERDSLSGKLRHGGSNKNEPNTERTRATLEARIKELKRKVGEHEKTLRMQTLAEKKCERLEAELRADKRRRADLQKKVKELSAEHRNEKKKARNNASRLLRDSQKLKLELTKVKEAAARQESVLKRKATEAMNRQKLLAEQAKKRNRSSACVSSQLSAERKEEINCFVERELSNALTLEDLRLQIEESTRLLQEAEEKMQVLISQQMKAQEDSTAIRTLDAEIDLRSKVINQLETNVNEIYKSVNRNPNTVEKNAYSFLDQQVWKAYSRSELRYVSQVYFQKLAQVQHQFDSMKNELGAKVTFEVARAVKEESRGRTKDIMALKVHHSEEIAQLLESTKSTVQRDVTKKIASSISVKKGQPTNETMQSIDLLLNDYLSSCSTIGAKVQSELEAIKASQEGMKSLADEIITQNEAKAMLSLGSKKAAKKKTKKKEIIELEPEDVFQSDEDNDDGLHDDGDDSDWAPTPLKKRRKEERKDERKKEELPLIGETIVDEKIEDFQKMTVVQLKELLRENGLTVSGKKAELIQRLTFNRKAREVVTASARKRQRIDPPSLDITGISVKRLRLSPPASPKRLSPKRKSPPSSRKSARKLTAATQASLLRRRKSPRGGATTSNKTHKIVRTPLCQTENKVAEIPNQATRTSSTDTVSTISSSKRSTSRTKTVNKNVPSDTKENVPPRSDLIGTPKGKRKAPGGFDRISASPATARSTRSRPLSKITNSARKRRNNRRENMSKSVNAALAQLEALQSSI